MSSSPSASPSSSSSVSPSSPAPSPSPPSISPLSNDVLSAYFRRCIAALRDLKGLSLINAFYERIGFSPSSSSSSSSSPPSSSSVYSDMPSFLSSLMVHFIDAVPFENLSMQSHSPLLIHPSFIIYKIIKRRQGGFCFELSGLFGHMLEEIDRCILAPSSSSPSPLPRLKVEYVTCAVNPNHSKEENGDFMTMPTHLVLIVTVFPPPSPSSPAAPRRYVIDVAFANSPWQPIPYIIDEELKTAAEFTYRIHEEREWEREGEGQQKEERNEGEQRPLYHCLQVWSEEKKHWFSRYKWFPSSILPSFSPLAHLPNLQFVLATPAVFLYSVAAIRVEKGTNVMRVLSGTQYTECVRPRNAQKTKKIEGMSEEEVERMLKEAFGLDVEDVKKDIVGGTRSINHGGKEKYTPYSVEEVERAHLLFYKELEMAGELQQARAPALPPHPSFPSPSASLSPFPVYPIGYVHSSRSSPSDDNWDKERAFIRLEPGLFPDALRSLSSFSHVEVLFLFHLVPPSSIVTAARHPRNNEQWPRVGILAQRGKNRPNRCGSTVCRVKEVREEQGEVELEGLDAVEGTPVIDIKPVMREFMPRGEVKQPQWSEEIMKEYWNKGA